MTAIVGVLNKHAVAIAADSAVTIGGTKVFNSANKIFALSKRAPIAIATYNNPDLNSVPWEIIIKEYRKKLADSKKGTLKEYVDDFFKFIRSNNYFSTDNEQREFLKIRFCTYIDLCLQEISIANPTDDDINNDIELRLIKLRENRKARDCFGEFSLNDFQANFNTEIEFAISRTGRTLDKDKITELLYSVFMCNIWGNYYSGLVFIGYGENEIYPSLFSFKSYTIINGTLHLESCPNEDVIIGQNCIAAIRPFAQRDVMDTIISGIAPTVQNAYVQAFKTQLTSILNDLAQQVEGLNTESAELIRNKLSEEQMNGDITTNYITYANMLANTTYMQPFINSAISLNIEDLADFAESLIKLTAVKRKISPDQPTVGGPIDVMVISKGDGIIWMKRKHYFDPNLNHHFFENYNHQ